MKKKIKIERWANWNTGYQDPLEYSALFLTEAEAKKAANFEDWIQVKLTGEVEIEVPEPKVEVTPSMIESIWNNYRSSHTTEPLFHRHLINKLFGDSASKEG